MKLFCFKIFFKLVLFLYLSVNVETKSEDRVSHRTRAPRLQHPCNIIKFTSEVAECRKGENITTEDRCKTLGCCWGLNRCFKKPVKCFVDLRKEKCFKLQPRKNDFDAGFSADGSHCFCLVHWKDFAARFYMGFIEGKGFPISQSEDGVCSSTMTYIVKKSTLDPNIGKLHVLNTSIEKLDFWKIRRKYDCNLIMDRVCVLPNRYFRFPVNFNQITTSCICRIDAWVEDENEDQENISKEILSLGGGLNILDTFSDSSWRKRVEIVNNNEMDLVIKAIKNVTRIPEKLKKDDKDVLLDNFRKVSLYDLGMKINNLPANHLINDAVFITSRLLKATNDEEKTKLRRKRDLECYERQQMQSRFIEVFETIMSNVAHFLDAKSKQQGFVSDFQTQNIDFRMQVAMSTKLSRRRLTHTSQKDGVEVLSLPEAENGSSSAIITTFYKDLPNDVINKSTSRISDFLSVHVQNDVNGEVHRISVPVQFTLRRDVSQSGVCAFIDPMTGGWSSFGCYVFESSANSTTCRCNHTTHFALLLKFAGSKMKDEHLLEVFSLTLGSVSCFLLLVTAVIFVYYRNKLLKDRMLIHFHLICALIGGYLSIMAASISVSTDQISVTNSCIVFSFFTHFFYLSVFFWSLIEGVYLFYKIVLVFQKKFLEKLIKLSPVVGWLLPALIVIVSMVISRSLPVKTLHKASEEIDVHVLGDGYVNPKTCFLNVQNGIIWSYLGPVILITGINFLILLKICQIVFRSTNRSMQLRNERGASKSIKKSVKGAMLLMPILSLPWIFGLLYDLYQDKEVEGINGRLRTIIGITGAYFQVIFAGVQGILIFFFYCIYNSEVRTAHSLAQRKRKSIASSQIRSSSTKRRKFSELFTWKGVNRNVSISKSSEMSTFPRSNTLLRSENFCKLTGTQLPAYRQPSRKFTTESFKQPQSRSTSNETLLND